ncbi:MAG: guanosine polyphosphate pyrophosphohydrolase [Rickettsia sp.]|jgi:hypothetical protein|nr:guanosine polyphosphate pyrophosphohydrolase [Rickettsia sp.]
MEDINNWETRHTNCHYAERLLNKLSELNQQVMQQVDINEITKGIYYAKNIMAAKCDNPVILIILIQ